ncbi:hypothetical protein Bbelb_168000 [Branchiostoma belcheri]|nr:hypothetical protein Bbelb_168000 [Branchiostoma belcheri]
MSKTRAAGPKLAGPRGLGMRGSAGMFRLTTARADEGQTAHVIVSAARWLLTYKLLSNIQNLNPTTNRQWWLAATSSDIQITRGCGSGQKRQSRRRERQTEPDSTVTCARTNTAAAQEEMTTDFVTRF